MLFLKYLDSLSSPSSWMMDEFYMLQFAFDNLTVNEIEKVTHIEFVLGTADVLGTKSYNGIFLILADGTSRSFDLVRPRPISLKRKYR